jgi:DNA-binding CsgD family transcriptional regulator
MISALVVLYILLIGLAAGCSLASYRLRQRYNLRFLKTYHIFILLSSAYAILNFIGEVFVPTVFSRPSESLAPAFMIVDLVTIPLLGGLFFFLFWWITRLLDRPIPPSLRTVFCGVEILFLAGFMAVFISYFAHGLTTVSVLGFYLLNTIILILLISAVFILVFVKPAGEDPDRRRLTRGLGFVYAFSFALLGLILMLPRRILIQNPSIAGSIPAGMIFLVNLLALIYLRRFLGSRPAFLAQASSETRSPTGLTRDAGISAREREIIQLVAQGLDNREIGIRLFISPKTVKNHMTSIYAKTGARNRVQLANRLNRPGGDAET